MGEGVVGKGRSMGHTSQAGLLGLVVALLRRVSAAEAHDSLEVDLGDLAERDAKTAVLVVRGRVLLAGDLARRRERDGERDALAFRQPTLEGALTIGDRERVGRVGVAAAVEGRGGEGLGPLGAALVLEDELLIHRTKEGAGELLLGSADDGVDGDVVVAGVSSNQKR